MIVDARTLSDADSLRADVCIVGAGPAGLTLARELAAEGSQVVLIESGGLEADRATQDLAIGQTDGDAYFPLEQTRSRRLGGTAHLWDTEVRHGVLGFRCGPLDPIDFEDRPGLPLRGWPFGRDELEPYYRRAQELCGLGPCEYEGERWSEAGRVLPCDSQIARTSVWQFAAQERFAKIHPAELASSTAITTCLHANAIGLEFDASGALVTRLKIGALDGRRFSVRAMHYVLAAGGIENARLLLASRRRNGVAPGNEHDLVGRFFMEHPFLHAGTFFPARPAGLASLHFYDQRRVRDGMVMGKLGLAPEVLRREGLLNAAMMFVPKHGRYHPAAWRSLRALVRAGARRRAPACARRHWRNVYSGLDYIALELARRALRRPHLAARVAPAPGIVSGHGWSEAADSAQRYHAFDAYLVAEQAPQRDHRVTLDDARDALGSPRARLAWRVDDLTARSALRTCELLAEELQRCGAGRLRVEPDGERLHVFYPGLHHHLGTTRMHRDPRHGVVDADGRVHGLRNLHLTGGSVFPTGGYINPTLTVTALAVRLGAHLGPRLRHESDPVSLRLPSA